MAEKNFSRSQLFALRNNIAIDILIKEVLHVPCKSRQGRFSFLCPLCKQFDTSVNYKTNLARCFACEKNFNTIDLVMAIMQSDFVDSVRFLKKLHDRMLSGPIGNRVNVARDLQTSHTDLKKSACPVPVHVGNVINDIVKPMINSETEKHLSNNSQTLLMGSEINDRIAKLEQKMEVLAYQLNKMLKVMDRLFPSL
jgi:hypothetical protein